MPLRISHPSPEFKKDLETYREERQPIIEDLLYEKQVFMLCADAGVGKSVFSQQAFISLTYPHSFCGLFPIPVARRCYYLQLEGDYGEYIDRARLMQGIIPFGETDFIWDECRIAEVGNSQWVGDTLKLMAPLKPEIFFVDGLYKLTSLPLASEEGSKAIVRFFDKIQGEFGCAIWANHHIHRPRYDKGRQVDEDDPYYGSQWLKAHVDTSYLMKRGDKNLVGLFNKKSRGADVQKEIFLHFNPETYTLYTTQDKDEMSGEEKVLNFYKKCKAEGRNHTIYEEVQAETQLSHAHLRRIQMRHIKSNIIVCNKRSGHHRLWELNLSVI